MNTTKVAIVAALLLVSAVVAYAVADDTDAANEGSCGDNLTYSLEVIDGTENYKLTITGYGAMADYDSPLGSGSNKAPWFNELTSSGAEPADITSIQFVSSGGDLTYIGANSFLQTGITEIEIPDTVTSIGANAFWGCDVSADLPSGLTSLGDTAFYGNYTLADSNGSVYSVQDNAIFTTEDGKKVLVQVPWNMPISKANECLNDVEIIGKFAYNGYNGGLTSGPSGDSLGISIPSSVTEIRDAAFENSWITSVEFNEGLESIKASAFNKCQYLGGSLVFPSTLTDVGGAAFSGGSSGTYNKVTSIEFEDRVVADDNLVSIGGDAFSGCNNATSLDLGNAIGSFGNLVFKDLVSLEGDIVIPDTVTTYGTGLFSGCTSLNGTITTSYSDGPLNKILGTGPTFTSLVFTGTKVPSQYVQSWDSLTIVTLSENVTEIGSSAFSGTSISSIVMSEGLTSIGGWSFTGTDLQGEVTIPASVKSIGESAFQELKGITSVVVSEGLETIGKQAFAWCDNLISFGKTGSDGNVFPDTLVSIGEGAFRGDALTGPLTLPGCEVGTYAFLSCKNLSGTLTFTSSADVAGTVTIGDSAFSSCSGIESIILPVDLTSIGQSAFVACTALTHVGVESSPSDVNVFPASLTSIGSEAFRNTGLLGSLYFTQGIQTIGSGAFQGCEDLVAAYLPKGITSIENNAFVSMDLVNDPNGAAVIYCANDSVVNLMKEYRQIIDGVSTAGQGNYYNRTTAIANMDGGSLEPSDFEGYVRGTLLTPELTNNILLGWTVEGTEGYVNAIEAVANNDDGAWFRYQEIFKAAWAEESTVITDAVLSGITVKSETSVSYTGVGWLPVEGTPTVTVNGTQMTDTAYTLTITGGDYPASYTFSSGTAISNIADLKMPSVPGTYLVTISGTGASDSKTYVVEGSWEFVILSPEFEYANLTVSVGTTFENHILYIGECQFTYKSSDTNVATVTNGDVTAVAAGNTTITATNGDVSISFALTVDGAEIAPVSSDGAVLATTEVDSDMESQYREKVLEKLDESSKEEASKSMTILDIVNLGDNKVTSFTISFGAINFLGTSSDYDFYVYHCVDNKWTLCVITVEEDGLTVETDGLSPFAVYYLEKTTPVDPPEPPIDDNPEDGQSPLPDDEDLPLPPVVQGQGSDSNTTTIVACAAAAVVAALIAAFLIIDRRS